MPAKLVKDFQRSSHKFVFNLGAGNVRRNCSISLWICKLFCISWTQLNQEKGLRRIEINIYDIDSTKIVIEIRNSPHSLHLHKSMENSCMHPLSKNAVLEVRQLGMEVFPNLLNQFRKLP